ncbi:ABC transporter substrate-binding protein [Gordonia sp. KTR9]|uniref:ABC transporter substrate-binding protein n=1 Tax=Gordonia sp. KTR9 TaxID=337191 RepID=UPI00027DE842|nr:extracellular solute-binding protein [Gordonia sp. KTR9]AFR51023.1 ABC-type Fe3+ transport system, periplasmic component [Gordonia sp. KTR9]
MRVRTAVATVVAAALVVAIAACGSSPASSGPVDGDWAEVVAAAEAEGSVFLYSTQHPDNLARLKTAFEDEYPGITLEFVRGTDVEINPRVETENRTGKGTADVHMTSDPAWITTAAESGRYSTPIVGPAFDTAGYERDRSVLDDRLFLVSAAVFALGWNTSALPGGLQTPGDLLTESLRGKIGVVNPAGFAAVVDEYRFFDENWSPDFNRRLAALRPRVYPSALGVAQALNSGEIAATPMVQPLVREQGAGAPVGWVLPQPAWGTPWYSHVLTSAPHPNAAQVLADFLVTEKGQTALSAGYGSALPDIPGAVARAQDIPLPDTSTLTADSVSRFQQEWRERFMP